MTITTETPRTPDFWLLVAEEDGRVLTVGEDAAPAVFSGEGEAKLFVHLAAGDDVWTVRRTSLEGLASLLRGSSCAGATRVALDPSPEMLADESLVQLVSMGKDRFLERFAKRDRRGSGVSVAS